MPPKVEDFDIKVTLISTEKVCTDVESLKVRNAGMVLLHPFMKALFKDLGLFEGENFIGEKSQERAACIWQYLATGCDVFQDIDMHMAKILCGYPLGKAIDSLPVGEYERNVCLKHLMRILNYWDLASDIDELRYRFLGRYGILNKDRDAYHLYVEQHADDDAIDGSFRSPVTVRWPWQTDAVVVYWE